MPLTIIKIAPEQFDPDTHTLPTAGELLLAGDKVTINADGIAFNTVEDQDVHGLVIEVSRKGDVVEIAVGEQQEDGGFYFEYICVLQEG